MFTLMDLPITNVEKITDFNTMLPDLREEAQKLIKDGSGWEYYRLNLRVGNNINVLFIPGYHYAGISWGSQTEWTNADSVQDALDRYFAVDNKRMEN